MINALAVGAAEIAVLAARHQGSAFEFVANVTAMGKKRKKQRKKNICNP